MTIAYNRLKHLILGLAICTSLALAVPISATQASTYHAHVGYFPCGSYHGNYWGYSYGYYNGEDITFRLQDHDGYDGYDYSLISNYGSSTVWYKGYYPDDEYWYFFSNEPSYYWHNYSGFHYRCFAPHVTSDSSTSSTPPYSSSY